MASGVVGLDPVSLLIKDSFSFGLALPVPYHLAASGHKLGLVKAIARIASGAGRSAGGYHRLINSGSGL